MDIITRNNTMVNYEYLITAVIRRNIVLLKALRIEPDDAYQELCIAMLRALESYNPARSDSIQAYIWAELQFAVLDMKRCHKPCGVTGTGGNRIAFISVNYTYDDGNDMEIPYEDDRSAIELSDIFDLLEQSEREALDMKMEGYTLRKKSQRNDFSSACEKMLAML